jgi:uncharacterized protein YkwD
VAAVALFALAAGLLANPIPSAADPSYDAQESQFLTLINNYRESNGAGDLVPQANLNAAADWFATDMATKNYYGGDQYCWDNFHTTAHCDSLGRLPGKRLGDFGYSSSYAGENIAAGFGSAQTVFDAWKASSGHNRNMLDPNYKAIGIGWDCNPQAYYGCYWVTDFGANAGTNAPTPTPVGSQPTPTNSPTPVPTPTPTPAIHKWDDVDCDGAVTASDAVEVLRGGAGIFEQHAGCPSVRDLVLVSGQYRTWGDTDCSSRIEVLDSIKLLAYLGGLPLDAVDASCPAPGALF